ncbi:PAS domain-containing protein [Leclercia adecarboxylata]|nr:PAS domain-containing protein [Leclercia adecarboxylata]MDC6668257.1 PAS domain-containing protein [Leclercia adecarboxylata]
MFNNHLKRELAELREEVAINGQIKDSLYREMMVLEVDRQGRIEHANELFLSEMGFRRDDLIGRPLDDFFTEQFRSEPNYARLKSAISAPSTSAVPTDCYAAMARKPGCARSGNRSRARTGRCIASPCARLT